MMEWAFPACFRPGAPDGIGVPALRSPESNQRPKNLLVMKEIVREGWEEEEGCGNI